MSNRIILLSTLGLSMLLSSCTSSNKSAGEQKPESGSSLYANHSPRENDPCDPSDPFCNGGGGESSEYLSGQGGASKSVINSAECASSVTTLFKDASGEKAAVSISRTLSNPVNKIIVLNERINGLQANMKLSNFVNINRAGYPIENPAEYWTISKFTLGTGITTITTKESLPQVTVQNGATAAIQLQNEVYRPYCGTDGIDPLYIRGSKFPESGESPILAVASGSAAGSPSCMMFVLKGDNYTPIDGLRAQWKIPSFSTAAADPGEPRETVKVGNGLLQGFYVISSATGQVRESTTIQPCAAAANQMAIISMGSSERKFSDNIIAYQYGTAEGNPAAPVIDYVCVTDQAAFNINNTVPSTCIPNPNSGSQGSGTTVVDAKPGQVLTIVGRNFLRKNSPLVCEQGGTACDTAGPTTKRKKVELNLNVLIGGVPVKEGIANLFGLENGSYSGADFIPRNTSANLTSSGCSFTSNLGGLCQRIHAIIPNVNIGKPRGSNKFIFADVVLENADSKSVEYGGPPTVAGNPGEQKLKLALEEVPSVTPTPYYNPAPLAPAPATAVLVDATTIKATFVEVSDDPACAIAEQCPKSSQPVNFYELRYSDNLISSSNWDLATVYSEGSLLGQLPIGGVREVFFNNLAPDTQLCFAAKAVDSIDQSSPIAYSTCSARTPLPPAETPPCPIHLTAQLNPADPTGSAILSWVEPSSDSLGSGDECTSVGSTPVTGVVVKYKTIAFAEGVVMDPTNGFDPTQSPYFFDSISFVVLANDLDRGAVVAPGQTHSLLLPLSPDTTYYFAAHAFMGPAVAESNPYPFDSSDNLLGNPESVSPISNIASVHTEPPVFQIQGTRDFVDLSSNLPKDIWVPSEFMTMNVGNSVHIMQNVSGQASGKKPWILLSDLERGLRIMKVADSENVDTALTNCEGNGVNCATDLNPVVQINGLPVAGDGQADVLIRDRHFGRNGVGKDCNGNEPDPATGSVNPDPIYTDMYAECNLPHIEQYTDNRFVEIAFVNNDAEPDLILASGLAGVRDVVYINSGSDLCKLPNASAWPSRTLDTPDGIPCFEGPIELDPQTAGVLKQPTTRIHNYRQVSSSEGPADLIMVTGSGQKTVFYKNNCKDQANCSSSDFPRASGIFFDEAGNNLDFQGVHCEDAAFLDLDADNVNDMICARTHIFTVSGVDTQGIDWAFKGTPDATLGVRFVKNSSIFPLLQTKNCNSSFFAMNKIMGTEYLVAGHTTAGTFSIEGNASSCTTELFARTAGSFIKVQDLADNVTACHNGAIGDSGFRDALRSDEAADIALACGISANMTSDPAYSGTRLFFNDGAGNFPSASLSPISVFAQDCPVNESCTISGTTPLVYGSDPLYIPGAVNAVGMGDLTQDGVPDLYFGNGTVSTDNVYKNLFLKHKAEGTAPFLGVSPVSSPNGSSGGGSDTSNPSTPTGLSYSAPTSGTSIVMNWIAAYDNIGVVGYDIMNFGSNTPLGSVDGGPLTFTIDGLNPSTNYSICVKARDAANNVSSCSTIAVKTYDSVAPDSVEGVLATATSGTEVSLNWLETLDNAGGSGVESYTISRTGDIPLSISRDATTLMFLDSGLTPGATYTYCVQAVDKRGNVSMTDVNSCSTVTTP